MDEVIAGRRRFLSAAVKLAAASAVGGSFLRGAMAQRGGALTETPLRDDLTLVSGAGCNVVVLRTAGSAAVVDSGAPESAEELAKLVGGSLGLLAVEVLFNTHWH